MERKWIEQTPFPQQRQRLHPGTGRQAPRVRDRPQRRGPCDRRQLGDRSRGHARKRRELHRRGADAAGHGRLSRQDALPPGPKIAISGTVNSLSELFYISYLQRHGHKSAEGVRPVVAEGSAILETKLRVQGVGRFERRAMPSRCSPSSAWTSGPDRSSTTIFMVGRIPAL